MRTKAVGSRIFTATASTLSSGNVAIELLVHDGGGRELGRLTGRLPAQDLRPAGKSVSALLSALAVAADQMTAPRKATGNQWIEEIRRTYPNAYQPWTDEDDQRLSSLYADRVPIKELSTTFGRQPSAINSRLRHLGLVVPEN
jgi:hypothetical protein